MAWSLVSNPVANWKYYTKSSQIVMCKTIHTFNLAKYSVAIIISCASTPSHVGASLDHIPSVPQVRCSTPTRINPRSHSYIATAPNFVPPLKCTIPLLGLSRVKQSTAVGRRQSHLTHAVLYCYVPLSTTMYMNIMNSIMRVQCTFVMPKCVRYGMKPEKSLNEY